jgi:hypothetical protein
MTGIMVISFSLATTYTEKIIFLLRHIIQILLIASFLGLDNVATY